MNKNIKCLNTEKIYRFFSALIIFVIVLTTFSCEENPNSLGANLIPDDDKFAIEYDTLLTFDSFLTDTNVFNTKNLAEYTVGKFQDPYFGEFIGSYAGQFVPAEFFTDVEFTNKFVDVEIDSAYIVLSINDYHGTPQNDVGLLVYELNTSIEDVSFSSNSDITEYYSTADLISSEEKEMKINGDSVIIYLKESFYSKLIDLTDNFYDSIEVFVDKFDGIAIISDNPSDNGGLYNFNVAASSLKFFYQEDTVTQEFTYLLNAGQRLGQYAIDYSGAKINNYIDPDTPSELIFLQGLGGMSSKLVISDYSSIFDPAYSYSIHKAEITIPVFEDDLFEECPPPERLYFYTDTASNNTLNIIEDVDNSDLFNGYFNEETNEYVFNISKHFKDMVNGDIVDPNLNFTLSNWILYPNRVILKAEDNIKMRVTYTKH